MGSPLEPEAAVAAGRATPTQPLATDHRLDARRVRSFVGLVTSRLGPRAYGAVSATFLALLVAEHTTSLVAVTFALTAHRLVTWIAYPIAGRISDNSTARLGRRVPFMAAGLVLSGICVALYTRAEGYAALVALIVASRIALVAYNLPAAAVTPETFGSSRWARAGVAVTLSGVVVGLSIRLTVLGTWDQDDPSTWAPAYYLAAGYIVFSGLAIAALVREAPQARKLAHADDTPLLQNVRSALAQPNAKVLIAGLLLSNAAGGAFDRAYPVYARDVLGAGGSELAGAAIATALLTAISFPLAWWLAGRVARKRLALWAGITGATGAFAHFSIDELWQSVVVGVLATVFLLATTISLIPHYIRILPRHGGLGQRLGIAIAPTLVAAMVASYISAVAFDAVIRDYRVIWGITAVLALAGGLVMQWLRLPPGTEVARTRDVWHAARHILWGRGHERRLFRGELAEGEADGAVLIEHLRAELDPYRVPLDDQEPRRTT